MADEPCAVLVDVDGTLVDTNYGHTVAWWRAMRRHGIDASMARLHRLVGMGADQLIDEIVGEPRPDLEDAWAEEFAPFRDEARAFPGAADLLRTLSERGAKVVLATSGQEHDVATAQPDAVRGLRRRLGRSRRRAGRAGPRLGR